MLTHDPALDSPLAAAGLKGQDFLRVDDLSPAAIEAVLDLADHLKALHSRRLPHPWLAGRTLGMKDIQLILGEILPNALPPVIVYASVVMAVAILLESALAFLRLSDPNVASWGNLIGLGRDVLRVQWYVSAIPGIAILVTVLAVSLVGQGLNDALNPRLKSR